MSIYADKLYESFTVLYCNDAITRHDYKVLEVTLDKLLREFRNELERTSKK